MLETGLVGVLGWLWMFRAFGARAKRLARSDDGPLGWLAVSLWAAVAAYSIGMLTHDAFSFIQETVLLFLLLGLGAVAFRVAESKREVPVLSGPRPLEPLKALEPVAPATDPEEQFSPPRARRLLPQRVPPVTVTFIVASLLRIWRSRRRSSVTCLRGSRRTRPGRP